MFSLLVSCSRHRLVLVLGARTAKLWNSAFCRFGPCATGNGFWVRLATTAASSDTLYSLFFTIVFHTCSLRRTPAFNGFFCEAGSGSTTCRFSLGLRYFSQLSAGQLFGVTETIEGLFTFPGYDFTFDRRLSGRVVINGIRSTTGVSFIARRKIPFLQGSRYHIA